MWQATHRPPHPALPLPIPGLSLLFPPEVNVNAFSETAEFVLVIPTKSCYYGNGHGWHEAACCVCFILVAAYGIVRVELNDGVPGRRAERKHAEICYYEIDDIRISAWRTLWRVGFVRDI